MFTFDSFQTAFLKHLKSKDFGAARYSYAPGVESPAAKEIKLKKAIGFFSQHFLREVHDLLREHRRLVNQIEEIEKIKRRNTANITKLANVLKTIEAFKSKLKMMEERTQGLVNEISWRKFRTELGHFERWVRVAKDSEIGYMHPDDRKPHYSVEHPTFIKIYDYELPSLKKKAPDQWLYSALDTLWKSQMADLNLSEITKYRIMAALLSLYGLEVKPTTIKAHIRSQSMMTKPVVKKS